MRGKRNFLQPHRPVSGLIPACAGKTFTTRAGPARWWAHPRVCGENLEPSPLAWGKQGSSPRVRGKHLGPQQFDDMERLIPACAGKTRSPGLQARALRAHPRVCGENEGLRGIFVDHDGSSPRVRGKHVPNLAQAGNQGLIPACAGKTITSFPTAALLRAHPRVCGENLKGQLEAVTGGGSSPRVRGKLRSARRAPARERLIPACAGKTRSPGLQARALRAHPRVCGENVTWSASRVTNAGSSPRVRGKRSEHRCQFVVLGLIPACAGKTPRASHPCCGCRAHPRVCGENRL